MMVPPSLPYTAIPRIIHQTYPTKFLPEKLAENVDHIKAVNRGWEHRLYDDKDVESFILENYGAEVYEIYQKIDHNYGAARADLFRYLVIYFYGGVYLDIKSSTLSPLDERLMPSDTLVIGKWRNKFGEIHEGAGLSGPMRAVAGGEFQNWYLVSCPRHPLIKKVIEKVLENLLNYRPWINGVGKRAVVRITGPIAYTLVLMEYLHEYDHRQISNEECLGLCYNIFYDETSHKLMFQNHYSRNTHSLIKFSGKNRLPAYVCSCVFRLLAPLTNIVRWCGKKYLAYARRIRFLKEDKQ